MPLEQRDMELEIRGGLTNQSERIADAQKNLKFSKGRFEEYPTQHKDARYVNTLPRRTSPIFKRVVEVLTMHLYKAQPTRKLSSPTVTEWLNTVYKRAGMAAKLKRADELSLIGGFAGIQFSGSRDPAAPVKTLLWSADELGIFPDPDDPTKLAGVVTLDKFDNQRRARLWTPREIVTFVTRKGVDHPGRGGNAYEFQSRRPNPYRDLPDPETGEPRGLIPFAFAHWHCPTQEFETNSPGNNLTELNDHVNNRLDKLGETIPFNARPLGVATGVNALWKPPTELKPGEFITLPAGDVDAGGNGPMPTLSYLMADLGYIEADWFDLNAYLDHSLEMHNCPPAIIRMVQSGAASGASLQAEQMPLLGWVEGRRGIWEGYEEEFARVACLVGASHLENHGISRESAEILAAVEDWEFSLRWPPLYIQLPGPERDQSDDYRVSRGYADKVQILMERQGLNEEEAFAQLEAVKRRNDRLQQLGIDPTIPSAGGFGSAFGASQGVEPPAQEMTQ